MNQLSSTENGYSEKLGKSKTEKRNLREIRENRVYNPVVEFVQPPPV